MSLRTENISLNCKKAYFQTIIENLHVGDVKSTQLVFTLTDGIKEIELPDGKTTAIIHGKKPDGTEIHNDCTVENNKIYYTLTAQDTAVSGIVDYMLDVTVNRDEQYERAYMPTFRTRVSDRIYSPAYRELETEPEHWERDYKNYYRKEGNAYIQVADNVCPTFAPGTFYVLVDPPVESASEFLAFYSAFNKVSELFDKRLVIDSTTTDIEYSPENIHKVFIYATIGSGIKGIVFTGTTGNEYAICSDGLLRTRSYSGSYSDWKVVALSTSIDDTNKNENNRVPSIKAVVDYIATAISGKADTADVNAALAAKANKTYVDTELGKKADVNHSHPVDNKFSQTSTNPVQNKTVTEKFNIVINNVNTALAGKANVNHTHDMSNYVTLQAMIAALASKADISDIPSVPTNVSAFNNDAGYITSADFAGKVNFVVANKTDLNNCIRANTIYSINIGNSDSAEYAFMYCAPNMLGNHTQYAFTNLGRVLIRKCINGVWESDFTGLIPEDADVSGKADKSYVDTELAKKADKSEIPSKISAFTNDVGYLTQHQDISGKENTSNKVTTISSSSTDTQYPSAKATKDYVDSSIESVGAKTKEVTQANVNWREGWKDAYNGNELNIPTSGAGRLSSTPIWIKKDTVLTVNVSFYTAANTASGNKAYVDLELYDPSDQSANAYGWVNVVRAKMDTQGNITISKDGYYVISVFNCGSSTALINDYGVPYSFSYVAPENFEPNYIFTVDWGTPAFAWITGNSQGSFSNGLNWVCRREIRKPYYLTTTTAYASEKDVGCYYYNTNDFSGTKSSASRQAVLVFGDEIWYFTPSPDGHTGIATIVKFKIYDNGWIELIGHCWHNLGHMNSVSYNPETDTLIFGNGSSSYVQEGEAYIINGFSTSALATSYSGEIVLMTNLNVDTVSLPIATYGYKTNVIAYGVTNKSQSAPSQLVVVLVTNDGNTIRYGTITGTSAGLYQWSNCVWDTAINVGDITETQTQSYAHVVQGITVLNGRIIWGEGHNQNRIAEILASPSVTMRQSHLLSQFAGSNITAVATYKGKLIYCAQNELAFTDISSMGSGISESRVIELINAQISNAIGSSY